MPPKNRTPSHPGEILREEFLKPLGVTQVEFAAHIGVPLQRVNEIALGKRGVSPDGVAPRRGPGDDAGVLDQPSGCPRPGHQPGGPTRSPAAADR